VRGDWLALERGEDGVGRYVEVQFYANEAFGDTPLSTRRRFLASFEFTDPKNRRRIRKKQDVVGFGRNDFVVRMARLLFS
jgi:hypothetical protein